jgi:hypothetical protein
LKEKHYIGTKAIHVVIIKMSNEGFDIYIYIYEHVKLVNFVYISYEENHILKITDNAISTCWYTYLEEQDKCVCLFVSKNPCHEAARFLPLRQSSPFANMIDLFCWKNLTFVIFHGYFSWKVAFTGFLFSPPNI